MVGEYIQVDDGGPLFRVLLVEHMAWDGADVVAEIDVKIDPEHR
jgi:hypothetical protein